MSISLNPLTVDGYRNIYEFIDRLSMVDYKKILMEASQNTKMVIEKLISILSGEYSRVDLYGNSPLKEEELCYIYENVKNANIDEISDVEKLVNRSIIINKHLRVITLVNDIKMRGALESSNHKIIVYNNGDTRTISIIIKDTELLDKDIISIIFEYCKLKIEDELLANNIQFQYLFGYVLGTNAINNMNLRLFITYYVRALLLPIVQLVNSGSLEKQFIRSLFKLNYYGISMVNLSDNDLYKDFFDKMFTYIDRYNFKNDLEFDYELINSLLSTIK